MLTKQGNSRNRINIKKLTLYSLLVALCLIIGYVESLLSISLIAIAPGVKLGLSNAVALTLICCGDLKGAWVVNICRICLSALLFGSPVSFLLSLSGGAVSTLVSCSLIKLKSVSELGISIAAGAVHNTFQCAAAMLLVGFGVAYYIPVLLALGVICGAFCGVLVKLILKKVKTNGIF